MVIFHCYVKLPEATNSQNPRETVGRLPRSFSHHDLGPTQCQSSSGYEFRGAGSKCITAFTDLKRGFGAWTRIVSIVRMSAVSLSLAVETRLSHVFFAGKTTTWQGDINDAGGQCLSGNSGR